MNNSIQISQNIIDRYKGNKKVLKDLKARILSGSCNIHDIALYETLIKDAQKNKKLELHI